MTKQCLGRRIPTLDRLNQLLSAWETARNQLNKGVDWQFTTRMQEFD
ncbi:hypothetical protein IW492_10505 [Enterococcus sp. BWB1-3]|nr:hypothetical protein [Enterococcus sp. BWB1-3]MBL1229660.1 hypothetical protein [Enterococcus sp. BWB1-3]